MTLPERARALITKMTNRNITQAYLWHVMAPAILAALEATRREALEEAALIARDGCLVPPDGGSPTNAEAEMCDSIAAAICALLDGPRQEGT